MKTEILNLQGGDPYSTSIVNYNARDQVTRSRQFDAAQGTVPSEPNDLSCPTGSCQQTTASYDGYGRLKSKHVPEQDENAVTSYEYNPDDTTASVMDARGSIATFSYNSRRLQTHIAYQPSAGVDDTPDASFTYDAAGNRLSMTDGMGSVAYAYDQLSRLSSETRSFTSLGSFPLSYQYNLAGELKKITDPTNASIDYTHDAVGRTIAVTGSTFGGVTQYATNVQYRAWGAVRSASFGQNTHTVSASYNARLQPTHFEIPGVIEKNYQYQADGRLRYSADLLSNKFDRSYSYDHAGRIKEAFSGPLARGEADTNDRPYKEFNQYDAMDHLVGRVGSQHWSHALPNAGVTDSFVNNRNPNWQYDADGRLTNGADIQSTFDAAGRATTVVSNGGDNTQTRLYDGDGRQSKLVEVATQDDGGGPYTTTTTRYSVSSSVIGKVITELDETGQKRRTFVYRGSQVLAWQQKSGSYEQVSWEYRDPSAASFRMAGADGNTDSDRAAEMDPLGSNAGTANPYTQGHQHWPAEDGIHPGFADLTNPDCQVHGMPTPCTSLNYEFWGSKIASLPGFGTNWGSFTELGLREYEQRNAETLAAYALAQRPRPRLRRAKKRTKKEIDRERKRNAGVGKDEIEPQKSGVEFLPLDDSYGENGQRLIGSIIESLKQNEGCRRAFEIVGLQTINQTVEKGLVIGGATLLRNPSNNATIGIVDGARQQYWEDFKGSYYTRGGTVMQYPGQTNPFSDPRDQRPRMFIARSAFEPGWLKSVIIHEFIHAGGQPPIPSRVTHDLYWYEWYDFLQDACK